MECQSPVIDRHGILFALLPGRRSSFSLLSLFFSSQLQLYIQITLLLRINLILMGYFIISTVYPEFG